MEEIVKITSKILIFSVIVVLGLILVSGYIGNVGSYSQPTNSTLLHKENSLNMQVNTTLSSFSINLINATAPNSPIGIVNAFAWIGYFFALLTDKILDVFIFISNFFGLIFSIFGFILYVFFTFLPSLFSTSGFGFLGIIVGYVMGIIVIMLGLIVAFWFLNYIRGREGG
mgnify:CR=1 FL=1